MIDHESRHTCRRALPIRESTLATISSAFAGPPRSGDWPWTARLGVKGVR